MRTAEKAGRFFMTLVGILCVALLFLPQIGISVDTVMSGSMEPALRTGGIVFTDTGKQTPEIGDIIAYQLGDSKVTHRVIRKTTQGYVTKGDANDKEDPSLVTEEQIIGKVFFTIPFLGYAAVFARQKTIMAVLAAMLLQEMIFLLIQWKGARFWRKRNKIYEK